MNVNNLFFILLLLFPVNSFSQDLLDYKACMFVLLQNEKLIKHLPLVKTESSKQLLPIEHQAIIFQGTDYFFNQQRLDTLFSLFEPYAIATGGKAFMHLYSVDTWFSIDSVLLTDKNCLIHFKTTSFEAKPNQLYIVGKATFSKCSNNWSLSNLTIYDDTFVPAILYTKEYIDKIDEFNLKMIKEAEERINSRNKNKNK